MWTLCWWVLSNKSDLRWWKWRTEINMQGNCFFVSRQTLVDETLITIKVHFAALQKFMAI